MTLCEILVSLLDDRGGPLTIRDGAVIEVATGRCLTPTEYEAMAWSVGEELAALEDES